MNVNTRDPWNLLNMVVPSLHCKGLNAKITGYDHTGYTQAQCDCGEKYIQCEGAYDGKRDLRLESVGALEVFAQDGG